MTNQPPDYDIFNDFDTWKTSLSAVNNPHNYKKNTELCENIKINSEVGNNPKEICKSFVRLFNILLANHAGKIGELKNKKYSDFMNYWLNQNLTDVAYHETTKNIIFQEIKKISCMFEAKDVLENKMYLMDKMKCEYNNGLDKCFYSGDVKFCKALKKFRDDYEKSKNTKSKYCNGEDKICRSLPELNISSSVSHKEQLNIAKIGIGLIGTSYAPYLKGYSVDKSGEYYNLKDLIFVQYNLRMEKNEDDKKYAMMKILHHFIQYCNKNKDDLELSLFMNEFIEEYYNKKKSEYLNMFEECKSGHTDKKYCNLYKTCNEGYEKEFTLMKQSPAKYIEEQEKHIKVLYPIGFLLLKAQTMIQDSRAMSKYSTTIISIMISIFLCFFFLYKVLKYIYL